MRRGPFGIMSRPSQILSCLLLVGWATSTIAEPETEFQCTSGSGNDSQCPPGKKVTDEIVEDMSVIEYSLEELCDCLGDEVLLRHLRDLSDYPFTEEQNLVLKQKLDKIYPEGYPDSVIRNLGSFMDVMDPKDFKKWRFSSTETLALLLANNPSPELAAAIIHQYTDCGGPLNATALNTIGTKYLCLLDSDELAKIDENAIKGADPLDPSGCSQATKDALYLKAKRAFSDRHNPPQYYNLIRPYLGGAPAEDLRALSKDNVNMDNHTFMGLKPDAMMQLSPAEVKALMGRHLWELRGQEENPPVKDWIVRQKQSELDRLGLGFSGGTPEGYVHITPRNNRPPGTSGAAGGPTLHLFPSLLLTLLLTAFLS